MLNFQESRTKEVNDAAAARGDNGRTKRATLWNALLLLQSLPIYKDTPAVIQELYRTRLSDVMARLIATYEDPPFITELEATKKALSGDVSDLIADFKKSRGE